MATIQVCDDESSGEDSGGERGPIPENLEGEADIVAMILFM